MKRIIVVVAVVCLIVSICCAAASSKYEVGDMSSYATISMESISLLWTTPDITPVHPAGCIRNAKLKIDTLRVLPRKGIFGRSAWGTHYGEQGY